MRNLIPVKDAVGDTLYTDLNLMKHRQKLFETDEIARAETIVGALEGLSIESAQGLLKKIDRYLLQMLLTR